MSAAGFSDVREVSRRDTGDIIEGIRFDSVTLRGFKLELEDACEDYGQVAVYRGTIDGHERGWSLDGGHYFESGKPERICKNTAEMLTGTRYAPHFEVSAPMRHMGLFAACGTTAPAPKAKTTSCC